MKTLSDINVVNNTWYRFNGGTNSQMMITYPVELFKCGTLWPGWLANQHPLSMFRGYPIISYYCKVLNYNIMVLKSW